MTDLLFVATPTSAPPDEARRLAELNAYRVVDSENEEPFDEIVALAAEFFDVPVARINFIDAERQWTKAHVGDLAIECARGDSFCSHTIRNRTRVLVIEDAHADGRFNQNPFVVGDPHIRFYAGAPLVTPSGSAVGALCLVDYVPRRLTPREVELLAMLARRVVGELELRRRVLEESAAAAELRELDRLRNDFVNTVAHEIRNPLTAVRGYSELLRTGSRGALLPQQEEAVAEIEACAKRLLDLVGDLLAGANVLTGKIQLRLAATDVAALVRDAVARAEASVGGRAAFSVVAPSSAYASVDPRRLAQALDNLLGNAVKYSPVEAIIGVEVASAGDGLRIAVADKGIGIPREELARVFEPFFRASNANGTVPGTGLGLAAVKAIVDAHHGRIRASSTPGLGTKFTIELAAS